MGCWKRVFQCYVCAFWGGDVAPGMDWCACFCRGSLDICCIPILFLLIVYRLRYGNFIFSIRYLPVAAYNARSQLHFAVAIRTLQYTIAINLLDANFELYIYIFSHYWLCFNAGGTRSTSPHRGSAAGSPRIKTKSVVWFFLSHATIDAQFLYFCGRWKKRQSSIPLWFFFRFSYENLMFLKYNFVYTIIGSDVRWVRSSWFQRCFCIWILVKLDL